MYLYARACVLYIFRAARDPARASEGNFLQQIRHMGKIYDFDLDEQFDYLTFQQYLDVYDADENGGFNISSRLKLVGITRPYTQHTFTRMHTKRTLHFAHFLSTLFFFYFFAFF